MVAGWRLQNDGPNSARPPRTFEPLNLLNAEPAHAAESGVDESSLLDGLLLTLDVSGSLPRPPRLAMPPLRPASRASSDDHSCAVPFWCAARPPLLAISRCFSADMEANPRRSLRVSFTVRSFGPYERPRTRTRCLDIRVISANCWQ